MRLWENRPSYIAGGEFGNTYQNWTCTHLLSLPPTFGVYPEDISHSMKMHTRKFNYWAQFVIGNCWQPRECPQGRGLSELGHTARWSSWSSLQLWRWPEGLCSHHSDAGPTVNVSGQCAQVSIACYLHVGKMGTEGNTQASAHLCKRKTARKTRHWRQRSVSCRVWVGLGWEEGGIEAEKQGWGATFSQGYCFCKAPIFGATVTYPEINQ